MRYWNRIVFMVESPGNKKYKITKQKYDEIKKFLIGRNIKIKNEIGNQKIRYHPIFQYFKSETK